MTARLIRLVLPFPLLKDEENTTLSITGNPCSFHLKRFSSEQKLSIYNKTAFEKAVACIKYYEGFHTKKDYPYIGYGHCIQPGEKLNWCITHKKADDLLRSDLKKLCAIFRRYDADSLLLATLAYNVGCGRILGNGKYPKSNLLQSSTKNTWNSANIKVREYPQSSVEDTPN